MSRLERWSRLKRNVPQEQDAPPTSLPAEKSVDELAVEPNASPHEVEPPNNGPDATQAPPEPGSLDDTLPDPETLEAGSDFSAFMVPGVSGALRRRALKRLWATGNYNVRDGLDDYDADYNKLLKPMDSELASKLRRWTHKVEEAVDKSLDEPESPKGVEENEQTDENPVALEEETSTPDAERETIVKKAPLDDQSDYLSDSNAKT
ncbi:DUF3306 domain-containing protein [Halomonas alkaliantarctica]|uniref:DUF3306 domain-containing protein n=1 Tax=Halomonas alkaliantarctica TaxID=232346 RepID=A0ABY8LKR3_9GAMM|nr:DUF3306 domain-containing protein [Halomonas alkaliantarctica]WGI25016.1 DUF3306 domain-containing protein [Halomonas alkaliantarctica]